MTSYDSIVAIWAPLTPPPICIPSENELLMDNRAVNTYSHTFPADAMDWPLILGPIKACDSTPLSGIVVTFPDPIAVTMAVAKYIDIPQWTDLQEYAMYYKTWDVDLFRMECPRCHKKGHTKKNCRIPLW